MPDNEHRSAGLLVARLLTILGLATDAYVHFDLASQYDTTGGGISQGLLFRVEAVAAILAALLVLASARRGFHIESFSSCGGFVVL
ncbi:MAG TPA: hypothetical protein VHX38_41660 [Pseudonocardiaceae bacterium]|jgi:hypothetical protein|nr:hypothetical protein [Pseudonocardiaceae bacterium]